MVVDDVEVSLRSDARRNTELLLEAARAALAQQGQSFTTRDLARRAGVGLGTVHRRLAPLPEVISTVLIESLEHMTDLARAASADPDPWRGFVTFAEQYVQLRASSCGLNEALAGHSPDSIATTISDLSDAVAAVITRTQQAGALRADLDWRDIAFALAAAIPPDHTLGLTPAPQQWRHNLTIITAGLRATDLNGSTTAR